MNLVYLLNGNGSGSGGGGGDNTVSYPLVKAFVTDGMVGLQDRCVTNVELTESTPVRIVLPPIEVGKARDVLLRLVITADSVPQVTFAVQDGESLSFEEADDESFACATGVNVFAFTETAAGVFVVNRKLVSVAHTVEFDANGGTVDTPTRDFVLGHTYKALPVPVRDGFSFLSWNTPDGREVVATDTVLSSVTRLVAQWSEYVDKYADAISPGSGLLFTSSGDAGWTIDADVDGHGECARSGAIADGKKSVLKTSVTGPGTLTFSWRVSSEPGCDKAQLFVDGYVQYTASGEVGWESMSVEVTGLGSHSVEWRYTKDASISKGEDCIWVDDVAWEAL